MSAYRLVITQGNGRELILGPLDNYAGASELAEEIYTVPEVRAVRLEGRFAGWRCLWSIESGVEIAG